jgi:hypothetical protein
MIGWEQLIQHKATAKTIEDFAQHTSAEDVMENHGWFYFSEGAYRWHKVRTSEVCVSGCQLAVFFGIHDEWLTLQKV